MHDSLATRLSESAASSLTIDSPVICLHMELKTVQREVRGAQKRLMFSCARVSAETVIPTLRGARLFLKPRGIA
jgi:hypothetical protein